MERLTTNKPVEEMNMTELARNACYAKDGYAWYRDFETDIDARELARDLMLNWGFFELDSDEMLSDEIFDETMMDNLQYGSKDIEGLIALFYRNLWAMADLHSRLKAYEDAKEQGLLLRLPCKLGSTLYDIIDFVESNNSPEIYVIDASKIEISKDKKGILYTIDCADYRENEFGTSVFNSMKEAEQAIARLREENG